METKDSGSEEELKIQQTEEQLNAISKEVGEQKTISERMSCLELLPAYTSNELPGFVPGIQWFSTKYTFLRKVRGDGNCFYRAFLFGYLEMLLILYQSGSAGAEAAEAERSRFRGVITQSTQTLIALGYSEISFESFYDVFLELLDELFSMTIDSLFESFQEGGNADYYTWFMRLLTACSMRKDADRFAPFIDCDIDEFCKREVEPMGKECEHPQITALSDFLGVRIHIEYLDGRNFDETKGLNSVSFPDESSVDMEHFGAIGPTTLLYRPGHYDLLYKA